MSTDHSLDVFISEEKIQARIKSLSLEIRQHFEPLLAAGERLVTIGVLKGAYIFAADLVRRIGLPLQVEFVRLASYGDSTQSSGEIKAPDLSLPGSIAQQHILVIEDIVDTGRTASFLLQYLEQQFAPKSLSLVSFLDKPSRREEPVKLDFCGFEIEDKFVVGYGLDFAESYRELPYLAVLETSAQ